MEEEFDTKSVSAGACRQDPEMAEALEAPKTPGHKAGGPKSARRNFCGWHSPECW